jgi:hypothetical protein
MSIDKTTVLLFDSNLNELLGLRGTQFGTQRLSFYLDVMICYYQGNTEELNRIVADFNSLNPKANHDIAFLVAQLRLDLRKGKFDLIKINSALDLLNRANAEDASLDFALWTGELYFVVSSLYALIEDFENSKNYALKSAFELKNIGAKRKAVRARMNALASESSLRPNKHYISDMNFILSEAKQAGDVVSQGITLMNLTREYQKLGLFNISLKYANRAVAVLRKTNGSIDYYLSLAQRAELFLQTKQLNLAYEDCEAILACQFEEARNAVVVLQEKFKLEFSIENLKNRELTLTPTWKERLGKDDLSSLTKLEEALVYYLSKSPRSKLDICKHLYGDRLDESVSTNRLNNLLSRVRNKLPGIVEHSFGKYRLNDEFYPTSMDENI